MRLERKFDGLIIIDDMFAQAHRRQCDGKLRALIIGRGGLEQRQGFCSGQRFHLPEGGPAVEAQRTESIGGGKLFHSRDGNAGAAKIGKGGERFRGGDCPAFLFGQAVDFAKTQTEGGNSSVFFVMAGLDPAIFCRVRCP